MLILKRDRAARALFVAGCFFYIGHVIAAFQIEHHWSNRAAYEATARQTDEVFHLNWGGGLYFNYVFTALWIFEAIRWTRSRVIHWFFAFMFFNATIVFGSGFAKWLGAASILVLFVLFARGHRTASVSARRGTTESNSSVGADSAR